MARKPPLEYVEALRRRGFVLDKWIGGGAYGNVYRADQASLDRPVAVKFYDNEFTRGEANRKRFLREAPLLARVQHPAIPYVITSGMLESGDNTTPFIVMEFIPGDTLAQQLENGMRPAVNEVFDVMKDLLSALSAAHEQEVVHRDVKPDNILVSRHGNYLIDFSIGVCLEQKPGLTRATSINERVGTTSYAAPEQRIDSSTVDHRADIYSAGVVLAEMLGARPPIKLDRLVTEIPSVSKDVLAILTKACAESRDKRFKTAADFLKKLNAVIGPHSIGILDAQLALCPNPKCSGACLSEGLGYIVGPKIIGPTTARFCDNCGSEFLRGCPQCRSPLPDNIRKLVVRSRKSDPDTREAYCSRCGSLIFVTPVCKKCESYLQAQDVGTATERDGCGKCRDKANRQAEPFEFDPSDDDIPF